MSIRHTVKRKETKVAMNVYELNDEQLSQLKWNLYYGDESIEISRGIIDLIESYDYPDMIPDDIVYELYDGIDFVEDDFA